MQNAFAMEPKIPIREKGKNTEYVPVSAIEYLEAGRAYCIFHYKNKPQKTVSGSLKEYFDLIPAGIFCKVHRSFAVNIDEIAWYDNHHFLIMKSGASIPISEEGKNALRETGFIL